MNVKESKKGDGDKFRINYEIRAPQVRVISEDGGMIGVYAPIEAIRIAQEKGLDLIEVAPNANPPTCKIMDYGKWKYENKKKQQTAKKKQVVVTIKEIQVRPQTDDHDIDVKMKHARRFILDGDKVKVNMRFSGREMAHIELGENNLNKIIEKLTDIAIVESAPKKEGKQMFIMFAPDPVKIKEYNAKMKKEKEAQASVTDAPSAE